MGETWWHGNESVIGCGAHGSEHAYIVTKWRPVMNLATKCAKNVSLWYEKLCQSRYNTALHIKEIELIFMFKLAIDCKVKAILS